jgi:hypothetical protein
MKKNILTLSSLINFQNLVCVIAIFFWTTLSFANQSLNTEKINQNQSKHQQTLHRLQLGIFSSRTEVNEMVKKLRQLDFEPWVLPVQNGYAASVGAFSSQSNIDRVMQRLAAAGLANKTQVVEVNNKTKSSQIITPSKTQIAQPAPTPMDSKPSQEKNRHVPKKQYNKLAQEVEILKNQVKLLLEQNASKKQDLNSSETDTEVASSEEPATSSSGEKEEDMSLDEGDREEEAEDAKRQMDMFLRNQKVLFKKGELELEFGLNYSQNSSTNNCFKNEKNSLFCQKGSAVFPKVTNRSIDSSFSVTYGIADDLALSFSFPYSYNEQNGDTAPFETPIQVVHDDFIGIGDISGSLSYMAWPGEGNMPSVSLNINAKAPTGDEEKRLGSGAWDIGAGISLTKAIDPVVFFGSLGYTVTLPDNGVKPGDQVSYSFGSGFSLNDRVSIKAALTGSIILRSETNGLKIPGSAQDTSSLQFSSTIKLSKALFIEPFVAFGLTQETSDYTIGFRVPYRFDDKYPLPFFSD